MNCEKYLNLIDDLVEGELDNQTAKQVNLHIFACPNCAAAYKILKDEKQIYSRYLFNIEPSNKLWTNLQARINLESDKNSVVQKSSFNIFVWKETFFSFIKFNTAFAIIVTLIIFSFGFGILKFFDNKPILQTETSAKINFETIKSNDSLAKEFKVLPIKNVSREKPLEKENRVKISLLDKKVKTEKPNKQSLPKRKFETLPANFQSNREQNLMAIQAQNLEKESAKQVEKIELLLRSFRNARVVEGSDYFDVSYEKQQARKLLEKNVELRRIAESYGNLYTEEILDKAESFLLDIANLENNPSQEKIINIKERVKNQNIIASLQVY